MNTPSVRHYISELKNRNAHKIETIIITNVSEWVDYKFKRHSFGGSLWSGNFPKAPNVGETWKLYKTGSIVNKLEFVK